MLETLEKPRALAVDEIVKTEEIVIKPSRRQNLAEFLGATIFGDGSVVPVLDLIYLLARKETKIEKPARLPQPKIEKQTQVMIVDDSPSVRLINSKLVKKGAG